MPGLLPLVGDTERMKYRLYISECFWLKDRGGRLIASRKDSRPSWASASGTKPTLSTAYLSL